MTNLSTKKWLFFLSFNILTIFLLTTNIASALTVGDFFLTDAEMPAPWVYDHGSYNSYPYMLVKEKLMGGDWYNERVLNSATSPTMALHVSIGLFATEAEAIHYCTPSTYIFRTDAYAETGQTIEDLIQQQNNIGYALGGGSIYGEGGFSGSYTNWSVDNTSLPQPFNVFRVGRVIFHTDATKPAGENIIEPLLVNKARRLLNIPAPKDSDKDGIPDDNDNCPNTIPGTPVNQFGCPIPLTMSLTLETDKQTYTPGETVTVRGRVTDDNGELVGASVNISINSNNSTTTSGADGSFQFHFPIPVNTTISTYQVTATVSYSGYQDVTEQTTFAIGQDMTVTITPDKNSYSIGDTVYCSIKVEDASRNPVPYADLTISSIRLVSGRKNSLAGITDALGENLWSFVWGQDAAGKTIAEGKLKVEVSATKDGFNIAIAELLISGCGDLIVDENEFCLDCPEDCPCGPNEICDPSSDYKNSNNMCSPKVACIFISKGLGWYHEWYASDDIKGIRKKYQKKGYSVTPDIYVNDIEDVAKYLSRPSTKAIAYAGHSVDIPTIETVSSDNIPSQIMMSNRKAGSFVFRCRYEVYAARWLDLQNKIMATANDKRDHPNLDYAFMFSCYSLANDSLLNYLLRDGGTYWGYPITLPGNVSLIKRIK